MLWWAGTDFAVNPRSISILSALVCLLIPHIGVLLVDQLFSVNGGLPTRYPLCTWRYCIYISDSWEFPFYASHFVHTYNVMALTSTIVFILCYFIPHLVAAFYSLIFIFIFIKISSTWCNPTKPASIRSPCGSPIMPTNPSPITLCPTPPTQSSSRKKWSLKLHNIDT